MIYDPTIYNENKHSLGKAAAFRLALTPEVAAAIIIDVLSIGGGRHDFLKITAKMAEDKL